MSPSVLAILSVLGVSLVSLVGSVVLVLSQISLKRFLLFFVSFSAGALLGDVFIHILPEMIEGAVVLENSLYLVMGGVVLSFVVEKIIHWRHCHVLPLEDTVHAHHHHPIGAMSLVGDSVHNFIDGILVAGSFLVSVEVGIATTIAVILHEIPQEISDVAVLLHSGFSSTKALGWNLLTGFAALLGAIIVLATTRDSTVLLQYLMPLAAGNFLYIAGSDFIPELHKEQGIGKAILQLLFMIAGIGVMLALTLLE